MMRLFLFDTFDMMRRFMRDFFVEKGHEVVEAGDFTIAMEAINKMEYDFIISCLSHGGGDFFKEAATMGLANKFVFLTATPLKTTYFMEGQRPLMILDKEDLDLAKLLAELEKFKNSQN